MAVMTITGAEWNRQGVTREVFLIGRWAVKVPRMVYGWRMFLCGLLANMQERDFGLLGWPELCPVVFALPGGWLVIMRRARPMTTEEWKAFDAEAFVLQTQPDAILPDKILPVEQKPDSFGWLDGRIVAVDYGN